MIEEQLENHLHEGEEEHMHTHVLEDGTTVMHSHGFQVPDCTGKPVQYSLGLCMTVVMSVFSMGMHDSGAIFQNMGMHMLFLAFMQVVL